MALRLAISSEPAEARSEARVRVLEAGELTIGRHADNDWALPSRHVSRHHCIIRGAGGQYWLTDTSSNGVYVDDDEHPVGRDNTVTLRPGQRLRLGDYELVVEIAGAGARPAPDFTAIEDPALRAEGPVAPVQDFAGAPLPGEERTYWGAGSEPPQEGFRRFDPFAPPPDAGSRSPDLERAHPSGDHFEPPQPAAPPPAGPPAPPSPDPPPRLPDNLADLLASPPPPAPPAAAPPLPGTSEPPPGAAPPPPADVPATPDPPEPRGG